MKKIKYLLFIIPLFFIFIGSSKAYDILTCGDTVIDENTLVDIVTSKNNKIYYINLYQN